MDSTVGQPEAKHTNEAAPSNSEDAQKVQAIVSKLTTSYQQNVLGQVEFINSMIICLLCEGHLLVESVPGLAKTRAVRVISETLKAGFRRVQFTPDLLPSDIIGTQIFNQASGEFKTQLGPVYTNLLLADEINRAPAKVQSAMLEAMAERQLSIAGQSYLLPRPFIVMATQNPIEQEGTYELPEAQLDRFFMKHVMTYPTQAEEVSMLSLLEAGDEIKIDPAVSVSVEDIISIQKLVHKVTVSDTLKNYIATLVASTRDPASYGLADLKGVIRLPLSPRATIALMYASRAQAVMGGRMHATPDDVKSVAHRVFRHRLGLVFEAELAGSTTDMVIDKILATIPTP